MALITMPPQDDPRVAGWLAVGDNCLAAGYEIILRAWCDIGICEQPEGSNLGKRIEAMTRRMGLTPPQYWCAIWVCCVLADRGCLFPERGYNCDEWLPYVHLASYKQILAASKEAKRAMIGSQILFGTRGTGTPNENSNVAQLKRNGWDAIHIGIISRITERRVYTIEGNRGYSGGVTSNGEWVSNDVCKRTDIIGIVPFKAADEYTPRKQTIKMFAS